MNLKIFTLILTIISTTPSANSLPGAKSIYDLGEEEKEIHYGCLNLSKKDLTSLEGLNEIQDIGAVVSLFLTSNQLDSLPAHTFNKLKALKVLCLSRNSLTSLPEQFDALPKLETLSLMSNKISEIPEGLLDTLPQLQWLQLHDNCLENFPLKPLNTVAHLRQITLGRNPLSCKNIEALRELLARKRQRWERCPRIDTDSVKL